MSSEFEDNDDYTADIEILDGTFNELFGQRSDSEVSDDDGMRDETF